MLSTEELILSKCGVGEDSWESLGLLGVKPVNPKGNQPWILIGGLMLKLQYFGHLMQRADSLEKTLMLGKIEGKRRRGWQRMKWLDGHEFKQTPWRCWRIGKPGVLQFMSDSVKSQIQLMINNLGKIEGRRRRWWQRMRWLDGITDSRDLSLSKLPRGSEGQGNLVCCNP